MVSWGKNCNVCGESIAFSSMAAGGTGLNEMQVMTRRMLRSGVASQRDQCFTRPRGTGSVRSINHWQPWKNQCFYHGRDIAVYEVKTTSKATHSHCNSLWSASVTDHCFLDGCYAFTKTLYKNRFEENIFFIRLDVVLVAFSLSKP